MHKISAIIFSRNNINELLELIDDIYDAVDQIVVVDSSAPAKFNVLKEREKKLKKLNVYYVVALGILEPVRPYGLDKCKFDWVVHLDVDERLSPDLKSDLRNIPKNSGPKAYGIRRFELRDSNSAPEISSWQTRLYNKNFVEFNGVAHELPIIKGETDELADKYYINHLPHKAERHYRLLEKFDKFNRITYQNLNGKFGSSALPFLKAYETLTLKKENQELSDYDYYLFYIIKETIIPFVKKERNVSATIESYHNVITKLRILKESREDNESEIYLNISNIIAKDGIVKYLNLRDDRVIAVLNKKYARKEQGINLLAKLLIDKYQGRYP